MKTAGPARAPVPRGHAAQRRATTGDHADAARFPEGGNGGQDPRAITPIAGPTNAGLTENGRRANLVTFTALGKYKVVGTINDKNLVELTTTWIPTAVYGDMLYEIRHLNYKDFGGVQVPDDDPRAQGDPVFNPAHNMMEIRVTDVQTNVDVPAMPVPDEIRKAAAPPVRATRRSSPTACG